MSDTDDFFRAVNRTPIMTALSVHLAYAAAHTVITLDGELDTVSGPRLLDAVQATRHRHPHHVILDTANLRFCDSAGLWTLLEAQKIIASFGGTLELCNVHGILRRVLDITGLNEAFLIRV